MNTIEASDAQLQAAGELMVEYTDMANTGQQHPPLDEYLGRCPDEVVRALAREGIESSLWLFQLRDALQET